MYKNTSLHGGVNRIYDKYMQYFRTIKYWKKQGLIIGERCEIYTSADFGSEPYLICLGDHVRINSGVRFVTHDGGAWVLREYLDDVNAKKIDIFGKIKIGNNVHIGTNAIIMPGVNIGDNVIIGCGAIVTKNIPSNSVAVGIPARVIESIDEYVNKNLKKFLFTKHLTRDEKKIFLERYFFNNI